MAQLQQWYSRTWLVRLAVIALAIACWLSVHHRHSQPIMVAYELQLPDASASLVSATSHGKRLSTSKYTMYDVWKIDFLRKIRVAMLDRSEIRCLAKNVYFEARGEGTQGMRAVAFVTRHRVGSRLFPSTYCGVVYHGCQFAWTCNGYTATPADRRAWRRAVNTAINVMAGFVPDNTHGALYFHAVDANVDWSRMNLVQTTVIRRQAFFAPRG